MNMPCIHIVYDEMNEYIYYVDTHMNVNTAMQRKNVKNYTVHGMLLCLDEWLFARNHMPNVYGYESLECTESDDQLYEFYCDLDLKDEGLNDYEQSFRNSYCHKDSNVDFDHVQRVMNGF